MKTFITFIALFLAGITCVIYQGDMNVYMHEQETLKQIAEEAACQAALCFDTDAFADGTKRFEKDSADEAIAAYIENSRSLLVRGSDYVIEVSIDYEDDELGYSEENNEKNPAVTVGITAATDDFFSLPFLEKDRITRESKYEVIIE